MRTDIRVCVVKHCILLLVCAFAFGSAMGCADVHKDRGDDSDTNGDSNEELPYDFFDARDAQDLCDGPCTFDGPNVEAGAESSTFEPRDFELVDGDLEGGQWPIGDATGEGGQGDGSDGDGGDSSGDDEGGSDGSGGDEGGSDGSGGDEGGSDGSGGDDEGGSDGSGGDDEGGSDGSGSDGSGEDCQFDMASGFVDMDDCGRDGGCTGVVEGSEDNDTKSYGYWKNHQDQWPLMGTCELSLCGESVEEILWTPVQGDAWMILANQWIAAVFNIMNGADEDEILAVVLDASYFIAACEVDGDDHSHVTDLAGELDEFNNGD